MCPSLIEKIIPMITLAVSVCAVCVAKKIAFLQQWNDLVSEYRSKEFGESVKAVVDFWIDDCERDVSKMKTAFKNRYDDEKLLVEEDKKNVKQTLHFHRRTLMQFYWQLYLCVKCHICKKRIIKQYFNQNEMHLMAIVYELGEIAEDEEYYRPLVLGDHSKFAISYFSPKNTEKYSWKSFLNKLYKEFKKIYRN